MTHFTTLKVFVAAVRCSLGEDLDEILDGTFEARL